MRLLRCCAASLLALLACQPYTKRPGFGPLPQSAEAVVDLEIPKATELLAEALRTDSIPVSRVETRDGYLETEWFLAGTGAPWDGRILGDSVVRVRGWVNAYGHARGSIRVETAVRMLANPSLPARQLDQQAAGDNPAAVRVAKVLQDLSRRYPVPGAEPPAAVPSKPAGADSIKAVAGDSTNQKPPRAAAPPKPN